MWSKPYDARANFSIQSVVVVKYIGKMSKQNINIRS